MSNKGKVERDEMELMKGVWEWWYDVEATTELLVDVALQRTERKGVFRVTVFILTPADVNRVVPVAKYVVEWPNSRNHTFAGCMMAAMVHTEALATDAYHDGHKPLAYPK